MFFAASTASASWMTLRSLVAAARRAGRVVRRRRFGVCALANGWLTVRPPARAGGIGGRLGEEYRGGGDARRVTRPQPPMPSLFVLTPSFSCSEPLTMVSDADLDAFVTEIEAEKEEAESAARPS